MKREAKIDKIKTMIKNAGLADTVDVVYDHETFTVRAIPGPRSPSLDEQQVISDIFDSCTGVYVWLDGELRIRRAQRSARAKRARLLYGKQGKATA